LVQFGVSDSKIGSSPAFFFGRRGIIIVLERVSVPTDEHEL
jgi:hypothetical protein